MDDQCRCCHPYSTLAQVDWTSIEADDSRLYPPAMPRVGQDFLQVQGGVQLLGNGLVNLQLQVGQVPPPEPEQEGEADQLEVPTVANEVSWLSS